jgi:tetratricopeptide (TPR) repeat protein
MMTFLKLFAATLIFAVIPSQNLWALDGVAGLEFAKKQLEIAENQTETDNLDIAARLEDLGAVYYYLGQYDQAEPIYLRSLAIREKLLGRFHLNVAQSLNYLGVLYTAKGQFKQVEAVYKRSLEIRERVLGSDHPDVATSLNNLAVFYSGRELSELAEPLYQRSLAIREKHFGSDHSEVARTLSDLAWFYKEKGDYARAEPLFKRALVIMERALGQDHPEVATCLDNLAEFYRSQGEFLQAEPLYVRALVIQEKVFGPNHPDVAISLNNLGVLYDKQGRYAHAEPLLKRALAIRELVLGLDHPYVAASLANLADHYMDLGQHSLADALYQRSIVVLEKALGSDHSDYARALNNLALLYQNQAKHVNAEPLHIRALAIKEKALGPDHPDLATDLSNLAILYEHLGQYEKAEPLHKRSLAILEKAYGADHTDIATSLNNAAGLNIKQGNYTLAESQLQRSLAIQEKVLGLDHPAVALSLNNLAVLYLIQENHEPALLYIRRASAIYQRRIAEAGASDSVVQESAKNRGGFHLHLDLLSKNPRHQPTTEIAEESFQIVQLQQASNTATAIAKMASRFASGNDGLGSLIRRKQDASEQRAKGETRLVKASSKSPQDRRATDEKRLRDAISLAEKEIETIDAELTRRFPEYQELTRPEPATVSQIRALMKSGEAMLVYSVGESSFLWVVKSDGAVFMPIKATAKDIAASVTKIRFEMEFNAGGSPPPVSVNVLHELYKSIFTPALPFLGGVNHLMVVPSGPLQSLPFGMLVASPPPAITSDADYRKVDWLAKRHAFSVLPSVSSIQAFRQFAKTGSSQEPFAGFGDPLIGGSDGATRGKRAKLDVATVFRNVTTKTNVQAGAPATEIADVEAIRSAPRLPETADELRAMAKTLKSDQKSLWLQANATETKIKQLELSKYRTLAFATHGVMAGEIKGVGESGLILTPPQQGTVEDDGYLSASEVAKLKLNADWVVLSACNTAAADGTPGAEGLSGLAKAFFFAGARSLLVSHWPVASEATVPLTTGMLKEYEANPGQGKAEAHRKSMMTLMAIPDHPEYAHPIFWAPFVVVGEGGAGRH